MSNTDDKIPPYSEPDCCQSPSYDPSRIYDEDPLAETQFECNRCGNVISDVYFPIDHEIERVSDSTTFGPNENPECTCGMWEDTGEFLRLKMNLNLTAKELVNNGQIRFTYGCQHCEEEFTRTFKYRYTEEEV